MGEEEPAGTSATFPHDYAISEYPSKRADALPCAYRGVCAHGSASAHLDEPRRTAESQRNTAPAPRRPAPPMCNPARAPSHSAPTAREVWD